MRMTATHVRCLGHAVLVGVALALGAGCARSQYWAREDFEGTKVKLLWYKPGANPRMTVRMSDGTMYLTDAGTEPRDRPATAESLFSGVRTDL